MPLREFSDERGVEWRVWDVLPERARPWVDSEFLPEYREGWLVFESSAGEKRRLPTPFPANWHELPLEEIQALCRRAASVASTPAKPHRAYVPEPAAQPPAEAAPSAIATAKAASPGRVHRQRAAEADERALREALQQGRRTFGSPRGREWVARLHERVGEDGDPEVVLRFKGGDVVLDLKPWPESWAELSDAELARLVLDADPPPAPSSRARARRRRREDRGS